MTNKQIFKVSRNTHPNKLAAAIIDATEHGEVDCLAIGEQALDNLAYALCIANNVLGGEISCRFAFSDFKKASKLKVKVSVKRGGQSAC